MIRNFSFQFLWKCGCLHCKCNHQFSFHRDLRAQLELAVAEVIELAHEPETPVDSDYMSDSEGATTIQCNGKLATAVRKHLAVSIQNLMQHGLMPVSLYKYKINGKS